MGLDLNGGGKFKTETDNIGKTVKSDEVHRAATDRKSCISSALSLMSPFLSAHYTFKYICLPVSVYLLYTQICGFKFL